eukprot:4695002-Amphidinium_carterae.1
MTWPMFPWVAGAPIAVGPDQRESYLGAGEFGVMPKAYTLLSHIVTCTYIYIRTRPKSLRSHPAPENCRRRGCEVVVPTEKRTRKFTQLTMLSNRASH